MKKTKAPSLLKCKRLAAGGYFFHEKTKAGNGRPPPGAMRVINKGIA
jgi:hypothetical protein